MGKRGPMPKPPDRRQGHRQGFALISGREPVEAPEPPEGMLAPTREAWAAYWRSDVASVATEVDLPAIRRLFVMYDQLERAMGVVRKQMAVKGSTGQIRVNPLADYAAKLDDRILRLESELGLTPASRARLGLTVGQAALTLEELNRQLSASDDDGPDPRLQVIEG